MTIDHRPWTIHQRRSPRDHCLLSAVYCLLSLILSSGCGYTTRSTLPKTIKTIHVELFKNEIGYTTENNRSVYLPLLEVKVRNAITDRFLFDGNLKIAESERADLILKGALKAYERTPLRYTDDGDVQEYRVHITVSLECRNIKTEESSWTESGFVGEATYFVTGALARSEESAVDDAIKDLARRIVERTVEDW